MRVSPLRLSRRGALAVTHVIAAGFGTCAPRVGRSVTSSMPSRDPIPRSPDRHVAILPSAVIYGGHPPVPLARIVEGAISPLYWTTFLTSQLHPDTIVMQYVLIAPSRRGLSEELVDENGLMIGP
jgi:hypothetical protein